MSDEKPMGQVIQIDEARIRDHLGEIVRGTVEETLNAMLDAEADQLCGAGRYERSEARQKLRPNVADQRGRGQLSEYEITYLFVDGIAERLRPWSGIDQPRRAQSSAAVLRSARSQRRFGQIG